MDTKRGEGWQQEAAPKPGVLALPQPPIAEGELWCEACQRPHALRSLWRETAGATVELRCPATGLLLREL